jgi:hypothetical protein
MVFRIITGAVTGFVAGVVAVVVAGVVAGVITGGVEVYHHSSARVVAGGVRAHLYAHGPLLLSR